MAQLKIVIIRPEYSDGILVSENVYHALVRGDCLSYIDTDAACRYTGYGPNKNLSLCWLRPDYSIEIRSQDCRP